jgi:hypothetical protein
MALINELLYPCIFSSAVAAALSDGGIGRPRRDFAGQQSELAELVDELYASREKISTLVVMWSSVTAELRAAEAVLIKMKSQPKSNDLARSRLCCAQRDLRRSS